MFKLCTTTLLTLLLVISSRCEEIEEDYLDQYILQDEEFDGNQNSVGQIEENVPDNVHNLRTEPISSKEGINVEELFKTHQNENDPKQLYNGEEVKKEFAGKNSQDIPVKHLKNELKPIDGLPNDQEIDVNCSGKNTQHDPIESDGGKVYVRKTRANIPDNTSSSSPEPIVSSSTSKEIGNVSTSAPNEASLPDKHGIEDEHKKSMSIFFVLCVLALSILLIHLMLQTNFQWLPESVVIVLLGGLIGLILNLMSNQNIANWKKEEAFSPSAFFLVLLPPIIFESGYNLHKGNFFQNIGSILVFAIFGTAISAFVIGAGIYLLGLAQVAYKLSFVESFVFGSLISAVDPVATVAIFHALDVDPVLNMLVFGESILNDAIAIVLTTSILEANNPNMSSSEAILTGINRFCLMFFASAAIGVAFALVSAILLKHLDFRKNPSLEFGIMLVFTYAPYALAEGMHLSGIMAILFCGIGMSHYTHFNLSTVTQITMQQTMRTLAFIAETCVFAYLGLALFSFRHRLEPALVVWSLVLCLLGRACNIFPLAILVNRFREHQITHRMMFIMWFSGLRGAISYALSLHLDFSDDTRHVIITTTLIIVLITTLFLGGSTMPLMRCLQADKKGRSRRKRRDKEITLSKTLGWGQTIDSEHLSQTEEELEVSFFQSRIKGFAKLDYKYFIPFFTRRFTQQELGECKSQMTDLTDQWYQAVRVSPNDSELEEIASSPKPKTGAKL